MPCLQDNNHKLLTDLHNKWHILTILDTISPRQKIMFQYKNKNIQFLSCMNKHFFFLTHYSLYSTSGLTYLQFGRNTKFVLEIILYRNIYGTNYPTWLLSHTLNVEVYFVIRSAILMVRGRDGSGGKSSRLAVGGLPVRSHPGHVEVSLSKTPNPRLLLTSWLVPCMAANRR